MPGNSQAAGKEAFDVQGFRGAAALLFKQVQAPKTTPRFPCWTGSAPEQLQENKAIWTEERELVTRGAADNKTLIPFETWVFFLNHLAKVLI